MEPNELLDEEFEAFIHDTIIDFINELVEKGKIQILVNGKGVCDVRFEIGEEAMVLNGDSNEHSVAVVIG